MSSAVQKTTKTYTYRSGVGGNTDVSIEYSADLSALSRLEVRIMKNVGKMCRKKFLRVENGLKNNFKLWSVQKDCSKDIWDKN